MTTLSRRVIDDDAQRTVVFPLCEERREASSTVTLVAPPSVSPTIERPEVPSSGATATTQLLLRGGEASRSRTFVSTSTSLAGVGFVVHMIVGLCHVVEIRHPFAHHLLTATLVTYLVVGSVAWARLRAEGALTRRLAFLQALAATGIAVSLQVLMGAFSPVIALVVLGISFFGLSEERGVPTVGPLLVTLAFFAHSLLVACNVIPDIGLFASATTPTPARFSMLTLMLFTCLFAIYQARSTQRAHVVAIELSAAAARAIQQRDAQLLEANDRLERLEKGGAGVLGRHSHTRVGGWLVGDLIGRGAMGEVYDAVHARGSKRAAIKLLNHGSSLDDALVQRFLREIDIASRLRGANLVEVFEAGVSADGTPFLAMERLAGSDLSTLLRREKTFNLEATRSLVFDLTRALSEAHVAGVVHRDLKPQNIFLATRGEEQRWIVLDFGIAAINGTTNGTLTKGDIVGSPGYMSPEQALGERGDARADIFSLGAVVYRVLTSRAPFVGSAAVALHAVVYDAPPRPSRFAPDVPLDVERVLAIALAKDPADRFASASAFALAFERAIASHLDPTTRAKADVLIAQGAWS